MGNGGNFELVNERLIEWGIIEVGKKGRMEEGKKLMIVIHF